jgi:DNA-binding transcriptional ArsR family regulator
MLDILVSSKTRVKLMIKFFLIRGSKGYLRGLEREFNETSNAVRVELNRFEKAGLLISRFEGKRKVYEANHEHPLYDDITHIVQKTVGIDEIVEHVVSHVDGLEEAYITGNLARGVDCDTIELALLGNSLDTGLISRLVKSAEKIIHRRIMYLTLTCVQMEYYFKNRPHLLIWRAGENQQ